MKVHEVDWKVKKDKQAEYEGLLKWKQKREEELLAWKNKKEQMKKEA